MGRSRESKQINRDLGNEYSRIGRDTGSYTTDRQRDLGEAQTRSGDIYNRFLQDYNQLGPELDNLGGYYRRFAETGGIDPEDYGYSRGKYQEFINSKGLTDENRRRIRGGGVYDEAIGQYGLRGKDWAADTRARATSGGSSLYSGLRSELDRSRAVQGGYSPGYNAQIEKMGRDRSRAIDEANLAAELGISDAITSDRQWGAQGMSGAEQALAGLESQNVLGGLSGLSGLYGQRQQGRLAGMGGMGDIAGAKVGLLNSLRGLRTDTPGEVALAQGGYESGLGMGANQRSNNLNQRMQYNPNLSTLDKINQIAGIAAPFVSAFAGGGIPGGASGGFNPFASGRGMGNNTTFSGNTMTTGPGRGYQMNLPNPFRRS